MCGVSRVSFPASLSRWSLPAWPLYPSGARCGPANPMLPSSNCFVVTISLATCSPYSFATASCHICPAACWTNGRRPRLRSTYYNVLYDTFQIPARVWIQDAKIATVKTKLPTTTSSILDLGLGREANPKGLAPLCRRPQSGGSRAVAHLCWNYEAAEVPFPHHLAYADGRRLRHQNLSDRYSYIGL